MAHDETKTTHRERATWAADYFAWTSRVGTRCRASVYLHPWPINLFAVTMTCLTKWIWTYSMRVITASRDFALDSYVLLDRHGTLLTDTERQTELVERLKQAFISPTLPEVAQRRMPRQLKHFHVPTKVSFSFNPQSNQHMMILETLDQPALLRAWGRCFGAWYWSAFCPHYHIGWARRRYVLYHWPWRQTAIGWATRKLKQALVETLNVS